MHPGASSDAPASAGRVVGPYRIVDVIGEGGMGIVYRAEHTATGERVAIKTVRVPHERQLASLRREIFALGRIRHPGVVQILDEGIADGVPWYAMELLRGETLSEYNRRAWHAVRSPYPDEVDTQLDPEERPSWRPRAPDELDPLRVAAAGKLEAALTLVQKLCASLAFLHGEGIVHRDLKSENVLLREDGAPVLIDFGLVWRFPSALGREILDVTASLAGTAGYMAPEQILGDAVDARADIYAVGCILYELLTGRLPYPNEALVRKLSHPPTPPSHLVRDLPPALDTLVLRLLERRARDRIGHAADVVYAIDAVLSNDAPVSRPSISPRTYVYRPVIAGRDVLVATLAERLESLEQGVGGCLVARGESGIGKTSVAMAVARLAGARGLQVVTGASTPLGASAVLGRPNESPLHPFARFLEAVADRCVGNGREATERLVGARGKILAPYEPRFATLPGQAEHADPPDLPALAARERLFAALAGTLGAYANEWPMLLVVDDLHWADELTLQFLGWLDAAFFREHALLVLCTYRTGEAGEAIAELTAQLHVASVDVGPLDATTVASIASDMLGLEDPPPPFVQSLAEKAEGNPFFVGEYVRAAVQGGMLRRDSSGKWRVAGEAGELPLPRTLRDLVHRRLEGLSGDARELLETASVVGRHVDVDFLAALGGVPSDARREAVRELLARQILEEPESGRLRFLHDKLREHTYETVDLARRRATHLAVARALEARGVAEDALPRRYAELAHHYAQTDEHASAARYLELAGANALATFANREAIRLLRRAIDVDAASGGTAAGATDADRHLVRARWERQLADAYYALGDLDAVLEHGRRALEWLGERQPSSVAGWVAQLGRDALIQTAHRLRPAAFVARHPRERDLAREASVAMQRLAVRHYFSFDTLPMLAASLRSVNLAERAGTGVSAATTYGMLGMTLGLSKLRALGDLYGDAARRTARANADRAGLVFSLYARAAWRIGEGAWDEVDALCNEALDVARADGATADPQDVGIIETLLAHVEFYRGRFEASRRMYDGLATSSRARGNDQLLAWGLYAAARSLIPLGRVEEARAMLEEAHAMLDMQSDVPSAIICSGLLTTVHVALGEGARAERFAGLAEQRIRRNLPTVFSTLSGYEAVAEYRIDAWKNARNGASGSARSSVRRAVLALGGLALNIPIGRPAYYRLRGRALVVQGRPDAASRAFERAFAWATRLGMPYEDARVRLELAALAPRGSEARAHDLDRADSMFTEMQCPAGRARVRDLRG